MNARNVLMMAALCVAGSAWAEDETPMHPGMGHDMGHHMAMMGDGAKVTRDDYMKRAADRFARLDVNKDGVIDDTDRKQWRERMHECHELMGDLRSLGGHPPMDHPPMDKAPAAPPKPPTAPKS